MATHYNDSLQNQIVKKRRKEGGAEGEGYDCGQITPVVVA